MFRLWFLKRESELIFFFYLIIWGCVFKGRIFQQEYWCPNDVGQTLLYSVFEKTNKQKKKKKQQNKQKKNNNNNNKKKKKKKKKNSFSDN